MLLYMISHHLPNASILDGSVTVQEFSTRLLDTGTNICCFSDRICQDTACQSCPALPLDIRRWAIPK